MKTIKRMKTNHKYLYIIVLIFMISCNSGNTKYNDTPTTGSIVISVDETFQPIAQAEEDVFEGIYSYASITSNYKPEVDAFNDLLKDSVRLIIASRGLSQQEKDFFKGKKFFPKETKIAVDGIALIVNNQNKDSLVSLEDFKKILTGKISSWKQMNPNSKLADIKLVFDNPKSSTIRFVVDSVCKGEKFSDNFSAMNYNSDVVDFVSKTPNAMGIIGVSWISDRDDTTSLSFLKKIRVMAVSLEDKATIDNSYKPYQGYIATKQYPLTRNMYVINSEPRTGLASGFASFVASDRGQRIILKSGIFPATQPVRLIKVNNDY